MHNMHTMRTTHYLGGCKDGLVVPAVGMRVQYFVCPLAVCAPVSFDGVLAEPPRHQYRLASVFRLPDGEERAIMIFCGETR